MLCQTVVAISTIPCQRLEKNSVIVFQAVLIASMIGVMNSTKPFQILTARSTIACHSVTKNSFNASHKFLKASIIGAIASKKLFQIGTAKSTIPCQRLEKNSTIPFQALFTLSTALEKACTIASQTTDASSFNLFQASDNQETKLAQIC